MSHLQNAWYANEVADTKDIHHLLNNFKQFDSVMHHSFPIFFIIDYTAQQYLLMTDALTTVAGYHPKEFLESRLEKLMEVYQKDDFSIFNKEIFSRNAAFLKTTPSNCHHQFIFSYNFRIKCTNKKLTSLLQRNSFITSKETGLPLYSIGIVMDISDIKTDTIIMHKIEKMGFDNGNRNKELIETNYFYPNHEDTLLSLREKDVLRFACDGFSSKQIAHKLSISENTIANHRQNMMRKTNTKNVAELIAFSIRNKLI
jgi:DNA-binding CsgD family transcriptional regulator